MISLYAPMHLTINREKAMLAFIKYSNADSKSIVDQVKASDQYFRDLEDAVEFADEDEGDA